MSWYKWQNFWCECIYYRVVEGPSWDWLTWRWDSTWQSCSCLRGGTGSSCLSTTLIFISATMNKRFQIWENLSFQKYTLRSITNRFIQEIRSWLVETFQENISLNSILWLTDQFRNGVFCHSTANNYIKTKIWIKVKVVYIFSLAVGCECNWASVSRHDPVNTIIADDCEMNGTSGRYYCFFIERGGL